LTSCSRDGAAWHTPALLATALLLALLRPASASVAQSRLLGRLDAAAPVRLALSLPPRNQAAMDDLLSRLYDPHDPLYGRYLTPAEWAARFGPTEADYQRVAAYARAQGLTVTGTHPNRLLLDVSGPAGAVEATFGVRLHQYQAVDGRVFRAPDAAPAVPAAIAGRLAGVIGLDTSAVAHPHLRRLDPMLRPQALPIPGPGSGPGTGPDGGLTPSDVKSAYGLNGVTQDGQGQTLAVFELDGYRESDIRAYESAFGLPRIPLVNVPVDLNGTPLQPGGGADETTLDIEMIGALAPRADRILVYETPNTNQDIADTYNKIATDGLAKQVSTCWGLDEQDMEQAVVQAGQPSASTPFLQAENLAFQEMAMQGQAIFAAGGDAGAYDNGSTLSVDDPASQPYVTGVGGTTLTTNGPGGTWAGETTWNNGSISAGAGGGGISGYWPKPSYQYRDSVHMTGPLGASATMRDVPDVSLNTDPNTGYAIYFNGGWVVYGGTSTAAPLWAGFAALANQQRLQAGRGYLGFANPAIYAAGLGANSSRDFHDIADGSTNLYYPAVTGYDDATGWGTLIGEGLLADLSGTPAPVANTGPFTFPAGLNLFSLPGDYPGVSLDTLFGYSGVTLYVWNGSGYAVTPKSPANQVRAGQGEWARFPMAVSVPQSGSPVDATKAFPVSLFAGWNQIGNPFSPQSGVANPFSPRIAIAALQIAYAGQTYSFTEASGETPLVGSVLYRYDTTAGRYVLVDPTQALEPGMGYWIYAAQSLTLLIPPPPALP